ncbi:hypothetical protein NPIL_417341 [Nephila pilipes]|uniref:CHHC U11-48K-type domain-containing protein n=1 Tax=Nephila pilipes TaxID=299642 RepID=A0A8X6IM76_NEPPI|nr:hypothetical protein NPIL_417341 [Nephila pilipes]
MDINSRLKFLKDLDSFLLVKSKLLSDICNELEWPVESLQDENKTQCPYDPSHWVTESSLSHHIKKCSWVKDGYLKEEIEKEVPDSEFFYQQAPSVVPITIDKETQANILIENGLIEKKPLDEMPDVPKTIDRSMVDLNLEQRLAIYDYVIKEAKKDKTSESVTLEDLMFDFEKKSDQEDKPKSQLEILAERRDYKRRRQSYRAKNVHITKKSYTEIMKEVIENQVTMLADMKKQETNEIQKDLLTDKEEKRDDSRQRDKSPRGKESSYDGFRHISRKRDKSPISKESLYDGHKHESRKRERSPFSGESSYDSYEHETRKRDRGSGAKESYDDYKHVSRDQRSRSPPWKKKKHKHDRSRSRSRSHKHKKSHKKHKKFRD